MKITIALLLLLAAQAFAGELKPLPVGDNVPMFTLKNYDGKEVDLKNVLKENKYAVLMFISTECPVSNGYNERMEKLYGTYAEKGIAFVGINANKAEDPGMIAGHAKE